MAPESRNLLRNKCQRMQGRLLERRCMRQLHAPPYLVRPIKDPKGTRYYIHGGRKSLSGDPKRT